MLTDASKLICYDLIKVPIKYPMKLLTSSYVRCLKSFIDVDERNMEYLRVIKAILYSLYNNFRLDYLFQNKAIFADKIIDFVLVSLINDWRVLVPDDCDLNK